MNTLDEPITDTLVYNLNYINQLRDINMILYKLSYVIVPRMKET